MNDSYARVGSTEQWIERDGALILFDGFVGTVFKREMAAYFNSPIAYFFLVILLFVTNLLFIATFFVFPMANMSGYFGLLVPMACVFLPCATMRVWAEERREPITLVSPPSPLEKERSPSATGSGVADTQSV